MRSHQKKTSFKAKYGILKNLNDRHLLNDSSGFSMELTRHYGPLLKSAFLASLPSWQNEIALKCLQWFNPASHGDMPRWLQSLNELPKLTCNQPTFNHPIVSLETPTPLTMNDKTNLEISLKQFKPWRKGPFDFFGTLIDSEWRSDFKWNRILKSTLNLTNKTVLDVGCGNGYYGWRMLGAGAKLVIGVDRTLLYIMQYLAFCSFIDQVSNFVLPVSLNDIPGDVHSFDVVFSMGVIYHERDPIVHLKKLHSCLKPGGELIIESIVLEKPQKSLLIPNGRYAKMRNVWLIPSLERLKALLEQSGFDHIELIDVNITSLEEQRATNWMEFESLKDFLDPVNKRLTIEGHPAPARAVFYAKTG